MNTIINRKDAEIIEYLQTNMKIKSVKKDEFGEVFTPLSLVNEILDQLPRAVWLNKDAKWLDPAAGMGHFSAVIYLRLVKSLAKQIPNENERKKHILTNMLYMVELNPENVHKLRRFFGSKGTNISLADFLEESEKWRRDLGQTTFDVVIGNPPFQAKKTAVYKGGTGKSILWDKFIVAILSGDTAALIKGGYLAFLTPAGWRRPNSDLYTLMTRENRLLFLHIYGMADGEALMGVSTRFDTYVIQRDEEASYKSTVVDEHGKQYKLFDVLKWPFLPNFAFDAIRKLLVPKERGIPVLFDSYTYDARRLSEKQTAKHKYPIVHGITQNGLGIKYAEKRDTAQFGVSKVLLNFNERQYPYNDFAGKYGMSQLTFGIPITSKKQGEKWIKAIESPAFEEILRATKWGVFQTDYRMFQYFDPTLYKRREFSKANKTVKIGNRASLRKTKKK